MDILKLLKDIKYMKQVLKKELAITQQKKVDIHNGDKNVIDLDKLYEGVPDKDDSRIIPEPENLNSTYPLSTVDLGALNASREINQVTLHEEPHMQIVEEIEYKENTQPHYSSERARSGQNAKAGTSDKESAN